MRTETFNFFTLGIGLVLTTVAYSSTDIDYSALVNLTEFVDKTLLIQSVFETKAKQIIITAPHRCGKSTNIVMLRMFCELQVDRGEPITEARRFKDPVQDTDNYKFFLENKLKITKQNRLMNRYFGKFPVIHIDFANRYKIKDSANSVILFREVIHLAFLEHRYLRQSEMLTSKEIRYVKKWTDTYGAYEEFFGQDVTNSLYKLAVLLYKHFEERKVVVLIDNYDFPTSNSMYDLKDAAELNRVLKFNMGIISKLLSADYKYVMKAVLVGSSYVASAGVYHLQDAQCFRFLENHPFSAYFSLTRSEVDSLFRNPEYNLDESAIECALDFYGGFVSQSGRRFYNFHSVLKFLDFRKAERYCFQSRIVKNLGNLLTIRTVREELENLVRGGDLVITMYEEITLSDIMNLNKAVSRRKFKAHFNTKLLFYFLLEQGYLTYVYPSNNSPQLNTTRLRLPNREVKTELSLKLKDYYDIHYLIDTSHLRKCVSFFTRMSRAINSNRAHFKLGLYWFYKSFEDLISFMYKKFKKLTLTDVHNIVFSMMFEVSCKENSEFYIDFKDQNGVISVCLVRGRVKFNIELIANRTSEQVLQHLLEQTLVHERADCVKGKCVYVGLGMDEEMRPSVSCLINTRNITDAIHVPET